MDSLLELESSLRTASEPRMPDSPAAPFMLAEGAPWRADANPVGVPAAPIPLRPEAQTPSVEGGLSSPPLPNVPTVEGELSNLQPTPVEGALSSPPFPDLPVTPEGLASKLAQAEGVAGDLNLAITPATNRLKDKLEEHPQRPAAPKAAVKMDYAPVTETLVALPDAAEFLAKLRTGDGGAEVAVQDAVPATPPAETGSFKVAQAAGEITEGSTSAPETDPAAALLVEARALRLQGLLGEATLKCLEVMEQSSRTALAGSAHAEIDYIKNDIIAASERGDYSPLLVIEQGLPAGEELLQRYQSVESRYVLQGFFRIRGELAMSGNNKADGAMYLERSMRIAEVASRQDVMHPLQSDIMHYYYDTAVFMGGETYERCVTYLQDAVTQGDPSIARWTARLLLAEVYTLTHNNPPERTLQFGSMIDELESSGVQAALEDPGPYTYNWLQAALESEIGQAYYALGDFDRASEHFTRTLAYAEGSEPKAASMYLLADIAARQNPCEPEIAIAKYQEFLARFPKDMNADAGLLNMAGLYHANGDFKQALQLYQELLERYGDTRSAPVARQEIEYILANQQGTVEVASTEAPQAANNGELAMHCGPQALQKLLEIKGISSTVEELAGLAGTDQTGTAMAGLVRAASAKGLALSGVKSEALADLATPFVALLDARHFVLVAEVRAQELAVYDAGQPESPMAVSDFTARWGGEALVLAEGVPPLAQLLAPESMEVLRGGGGPSSTLADTPKPTCKKGCKTCKVPQGNANSSFAGPPSCSAGGGGGGGGFPASPIKGSTSNGGGGATAEVYIGGPPSQCKKGPSTVTPGTVHSPGANSGFNAPGVTAEVNTFETSLDLNETDLSIRTLDVWGLSFRRSYRSEKGFPRVETSSTSKWWENNLGAGWSHNLNLHLRTSSGTTPSTVLYWDASGTYRTYTLTSTAGGYNLYGRSSTGNPDELGDILKRDTTTKRFTLEMAGGARIEFSAATTSGDFIARVESLVDSMGNTVTFTYDNANVALGKLTKVQSPAGDAQHLAFTYSGNLITKVELKKNTTVLNSVSFAYNGSSELVTVTDHASETVQYAYGTNGSASGSRFITKITNKRGVETDLAWTFGLNALSTYEAYIIEVDNADGLTTVYDRSLTTNVCTISNWDGATMLTKLVNTPVTGDTSLSHYIDYYLDATNYERWTYTYDSARNLTAVTAPGSVAYATYTYNAVGNVLTESMGAGPVTEYEYDVTGTLVTKLIDTAGIETVYQYDADMLLEKTTHPSIDAAGYQFEHDASGNLTKTVTPLGTETTYAYDALGRLEEVIQDPAGLSITTSYVYDDLGNMIEMTDPRGKVTTYEYGDPSCGGCGGGSNLIKVTDALSHETEWIYNADGLLETTIDAAGIETDYAYDSMNRLTSINHPAGSAITSTVTYNKLGQVASRTFFGGGTTSYEYDHMGRTVTVTDAMGDIVYAYNSLGQLVTVTDSLGHDTTNTYDTAFRLTKVTDEIGKETHYFYDAYGRKSSVGAGTSGTVDPTTYAYSSTTGQLESVEYGTSTYTANYEYDGEGRLVKLTDWIDAVDGLRYAYDAVGRLTTLTDYDDSDLTYTYDDADNVLSMVDYHGNTTAYTYNDIGQLATLTAPGSKVWTHTYDTGNRLTQVDIPNGMHTEYTYDTSGRQNSIHHKDGATVKQGFDYDFDDDGQITKITQEDGSYWDYTYDGRDRLITAERGNQTTPTILATYAYTYDDGDNMLTKAVPWYDDFQDGNITGWSGNTANYSVSGGVMKNTLDTLVWRDIYLSETDADHDVSYGYVRYSSAGTAQHMLRYTNSSNMLYLEFNTTNIKLRQVHGGTLTTLGTYTATVAEDTWYDVRVVLNGSAVKVNWGAKGGTSSEIFSATTTETATSRAAFFRSSPNSEHGWDDVQLIAGTRSTTETFTYNNANEQITHAKNGVTTTATYDDWGRLATRDDGTHDATYAYRYGSMLYSVTSDFPGEGNVTYESGGDKKRRSRIAGASTTGYNWDVGLNLISEENGSGTVLRTYTNEPLRGRLSLRNLRSEALAVSLGSNPASGPWGYLAQDHISSIRGAFDQSKQRVTTFEYTPYGDIFAQSTSMSIVQTFASHQWDDVSRMYAAPFRFYSANQTRWIQRDPLGMVDGPNLYVYATHDPIRHVDPMGLWCCVDLETGEQVPCPKPPNPCKGPFNTPNGVLTCQKCCDKREHEYGYIPHWIEACYESCDGHQGPIPHPNKPSPACGVEPGSTSLSEDILVIVLMFLFLFFVPSSPGNLLGNTSRIWRRLRLSARSLQRFFFTGLFFFLWISLTAYSETVVDDSSEPIIHQLFWTSDEAVVGAVVKNKQTTLFTTPLVAGAVHRKITQDGFARILFEPTNELVLTIVDAERYSLSGKLNSIIRSGRYAIMGGAPEQLVSNLRYEAWPIDRREQLVALPGVGPRSNDIGLPIGSLGGDFIVTRSFSSNSYMLIGLNLAENKLSEPSGSFPAPDTKSYAMISPLMGSKNSQFVIAEGHGDDQTILSLFQTDSPQLCIYQLKLDGRIANIFGVPGTKDLFLTMLPQSSDCPLKEIVIADEQRLEIKREIPVPAGLRLHTQDVRNISWRGNIIAWSLLGSDKVFLSSNAKGDFSTEIDLPLRLYSEVEWDYSLNAEGDKILIRSGPAKFRRYRLEFPLTQLLAEYAIDENNIQIIE